jgi:hypothetical protein
MVNNPCQPLNDNNLAVGLAQYALFAERFMDGRQGDLS